MSQSGIGDTTGKSGNFLFKRVRAVQRVRVHPARPVIVPGMPPGTAIGLAGKLHTLVTAFLELEAML